MVMFRGLRASFKKINKSKKLQTDLYVIKSADELLNSENNLALIETIKSLIKPSNRFNYYLPVIKKFAEFVQDIPLTQHGFFNQEINFLERGLERSTRTLTLCLKYFFPEEINFSNISDKEALWVYAAFTAALFLDIGKLFVKYSIMLYHKEAYPLKIWELCKGSMLGQGYYYEIDYIKENFDNLEKSTTHILARQVLDSVTNINLETKGFDWIASDLRVLETWLNLLSGEEDRIPMTSFMSMVPRAEIDIIENSRINAQIAETDPSGEAFLQWLRKELADGKIFINEKDAKIRISDGKIFISTALFQEFANVNPNYKHPEMIEKQFIDVAKLYQISISELDQRYRAFGGLSGLGDLSKRYRAVGGMATTQENQKSSPQRVLQGDIRLISLITSNISLQKIINLESSVKNPTKNFTSPNLSS
ncbi:TraI domain-containing protein [Rickettsiella endosymbiont of Miltochrista miniata]|uniref:TraI domain-containing protein n=1 Tax=Rickettsiella endosymbiont of Miltochrista miniata TaxID=3066239 RepID=UPI00313B17FB